MWNKVLLFIFIFIICLNIAYPVKVYTDFEWQAGKYQNIEVEAIENVSIGLVIVDEYGENITKVENMTREGDFYSYRFLVPTNLKSDTLNLKVISRSGDMQMTNTKMIGIVRQNIVQRWLNTFFGNIFGWTPF